MALFDFTSLFASENAARIVERKGRRILLCVAGDSLIEVCVHVCMCVQKREEGEREDKACITAYMYISQSILGRASVHCV